jgi:pimeloyl-ACP methyl ester carboxylesterase
MKEKSFQIKVPQSVLTDLKKRLKQTRWPDEVEGAGWSMGTNLEYMKELVEYWQTKYDWRKHEKELNTFKHFKAEVDGVNIHFIHEKGKGKNPTPIILTHGWPDSFYRFHKIIPMLVDPEKYGGKAEDSFDVIVPSVPGFGFSDRKAMSSSAVADLWANLMTGLGYERFAAAGGDVGSGVTLALSRQHPERVTGIHLTDAGYPTGQEENLSEAEQEFAGFIQSWWFSEGAYAMLHSTKPQTIAFSLDDSPVGLAAWILSFTNTGAGENVEGAFGGRDELLTNIMIYWVTKTGGSSTWIYQADAQAAWGGGEATSKGRSDVPAAFALFPREAQTPRDWVARQANVQRYTKMPEGGHFAALEEPDLLAQDIRAFFRTLR